MKTAKLNQTMYFKDVLTSEWKSEKNVALGERFCFCSHRKQTKKL